MTERNSKVPATNNSAHAVERAGAPILLTGQHLEMVAAAGSKPGVSGGSGATDPPYVKPK